jgi:N6-adenosine-specific RNA methylase IME4
MVGKNSRLRKQPGNLSRSDMKIRFFKLIPPLSADEYSKLEQSILKEGCRDALIVWMKDNDSILIDGHNRYEICTRHKITYKTQEIHFDSEQEAEIWILLNQLSRRNLSDDQRAIITDELIERQAKINLQRTAKTAREAKKKISSDAVVQPKDGMWDTESGKPFFTPILISEKSKKGKKDTRKELSKQAKVSERKVKKARKLRKEKPKLAEKVRKGDMTLQEAEREIKEEKREQQRQENENIIKTNPQPFPNQKFETIMIDPPWDWGDEKDNDQLGRAKPTYKTMSFEEILQLPIQELAKKNAHIYLWITNRSLPKGFALLEEWGFRYITCLTWCKPSFGMGNYFRGQTEHMLFGVSGSLSLLRKDTGTWFQAERGDKHSSKPEEAYQLIESCSPGPWLEMFQRVPRPGWIGWGGEIA